VSGLLKDPPAAAAASSSAESKEKGKGEDSEKEEKESVPSSSTSANGSQTAELKSLANFILACAPIVRSAPPRLQPRFYALLQGWLAGGAHPQFRYRILERALEALGMFVTSDLDNAAGERQADALQRSTALIKATAELLEATEPPQRFALPNETPEASDARYSFSLSQRCEITSDHSPATSALYIHRTFLERTLIHMLGYLAQVPKMVRDSKMKDANMALLSLAEASETGMIEQAAATEATAPHYSSAVRILEDYVCDVTPALLTLLQAMEEDCDPMRIILQAGPPLVVAHMQPLLSFYGSGEEGAQKREWRQEPHCYFAGLLALIRLLLR
jgi:hypothetical protein